MLWLLLACHRDLEKTDSGIGLPELTLSLATNQTTAGAPVAYEAILAWPDGRSEYVDPAFSDTSEPEMRSTGRGDPAGATLTPVLAGDQEVTASVLYGETSYTATAKLQVLPAALAALDLRLEAAQTQAGDPLAMELEGWDRYGNAVDATGAALSTSEAAAVAVYPGVTATVTGTYTVSALLDGVMDSEQFRVVEGAARDLVLELDDTDLEWFETTTATVTAWDAYDNRSFPDAELTVTGGDTVLRGMAITFLEEGWYTVRADAAGMSDEVGPFLIDSTGPVLTIDPPERGSFLPEGANAVAGTAVDAWSAIAEVTVNGQPVGLDGAGNFSTSVDYPFGMGTLLTEAVDADGNRSSDSRSALAGEWSPYGDRVVDGIDARINQGGFDTLEALGEGLIADVDLTTLMPSPAFETSSESCFLGLCITWYSIELYIENPSIGGMDLELDPDAGGWINTWFSVIAPSIDWRAEGSVTGIGFSGSGTIYARSIDIDMDLTPSVTNNVLGLAVSNVNVVAQGFVFDWDSWIYDVMQFFGLDLSALIQGYLEDALEDAIVDLVPSAVGDALGSLELVFDLPLADNVYHLRALPGRAAVDDDGMTIGLETEFTADAWYHAGTGPGSLYGGYDLPSFAGSTASMELLMSLDFLNQALYALWGGGILDQTLGGAEVGLDLGEFGALLGMDDLTIVTEPLLPPVIVPGTGDGMLDLQIGDLGVTLYSGPVDPANIALQVYAAATVELDLDVTADGLLSPGIGAIDLTFDAVVPANNTQWSADTEDLLQGLLPAVLPGLLGGLGAIPIPEIQGFAFSLSGITLAGPQRGYFTIAGDLSAQ